MQWIKASERMPDNCGEFNKVIIRSNGFGKDQFGHSYNSPFVTYGFRNYSDDPKFYFTIGGNRTFLTNENIEWLDESELNEPSIDEITRLQNIGIAMANDIEQKRKEIESLKQQLNEPSIQEDEDLMKAALRNSDLPLSEQLKLKEPQPLQETCTCTPDQTTGHTAGKCNVCGKEQEEAPQSIKILAAEYAGSFGDLKDSEDKCDITTAVLYGYSLKPQTNKS